MVFESSLSLFLFLPVAVAGFLMCERWAGRRFAIAWLAAISLAAYAWWHPTHVILLLASIGVNYGLGIGLHRGRGGKKALLTLGILANVGMLAYFKYAIFLPASDGTGGWQQIAMPLGISFFTFQNISYLADVYRGKTFESNVLSYAAYIAFLPRIIAGPIVRHGTFAPQLHDAAAVHRYDYFARGLTLFAIGLGKKVFIADNLAALVTPVFIAAQNGFHSPVYLAWGGAVAYAFQLYFDFSGYSDMAMGAALLFGIRLPANFDSPYRALNISDFWRRWHITLSDFLRDYLYIPLGGNRAGSLNTYRNLMITMLVAGLWHGTGWTFLVWGCLHGFYLCVHRLWAKYREGYQHATNAMKRLLARSLTFIAVVTAWVFFRADSMATAFRILADMAGFSGFRPPEEIVSYAGMWNTWMLQTNPTNQAPELLVFSTPSWVHGSYYLLACALVIWIAPSAYRWVSPEPPLAGEKLAEEPSPSGWLRWRPTPVYAIMVSCLMIAACIALLLRSPVEFLYYQF